MEVHFHVSEQALIKLICLETPKRPHDDTFRLTCCIMDYGLGF